MFKERTTFRVWCICSYLVHGCTHGAQVNFDDQTLYFQPLVKAYRTHLLTRRIQSCKPTEYNWHWRSFTRFLYGCCESTTRVTTREKAWVYQSTRPCLPCVTQLMTVFYVHLVIDQPQAGASGAVRQGRRHGPFITYKITLC
jgi:hypothetical protein